MNLWALDPTHIASYQKILNMKVFNEKSNIVPGFCFLSFKKSKNRELKPTLFQKLVLREGKYKLPNARFENTT